MFYNKGKEKKMSEQSKKLESLMEDEAFVESLKELSDKEIEDALEEKGVDVNSDDLAKEFEPSITGEAAMSKEDLESVAGGARYGLRCPGCWTNITASTCVTFYAKVKSHLFWSPGCKEQLKLMGNIY